MDGHPEVGADTLASALQLHRAPRCGCCGARGQARAGVQPLLAAGTGVAGARRRSPRTPRSCRARPCPAARPRELEHSTKLGFIYHRLEHASPARSQTGYADAQALRRDLELVPGHVNSRHVAARPIRRAVWQVDVFGFRLAGIDIPQGANSCAPPRRSTPSFADDDETRRVSPVTRRWPPARRGIEHDPGGKGRAPRTLDTVALSVPRLGAQTVPAFVISMRAALGRVAAHWLAQRARATSLRMVPLFETRQALEEAPATMAELYAIEPYLTHLRTQANRQTVMVGYSDSGKDTGYVASHLGASPRQEQLAAQAKRVDLQLELFHGRGGSPSRGGGRTYRGIRAQPEGTVEGPDPDHRAGRDDAARYADAGVRPASLEQTVSAVLLASALPNPPISAEWREEMQRLSLCLAPALPRRSFTTIRSHPLLQRVAPIAELSQLNIGSGRRRARGQRRRGAACDPVGVRVDAEPPAAAVLVRRGRVAGAGDLGCSARCGGTGRSSPG